MRRAKQPAIDRFPRQMLPWAKDDLVRFYKHAGKAPGWHLGRVVRVNDKETTVHLLGHPRTLITLPHSEFSTELG
jgi:hypothetical protein